MNYILKKTGTLIITLLIVSFLAFFAFQVIPGDPATSILGIGATPERIAALREEMGLNDPIAVQYLKWLKNFAAGDMGTSYSYKLSVKEMIGDKVPITFMLTVLSFFMIVITSVPLGIVSAKYKGRWVDRIIMVWNQIMMAIPAFFMGILLTLIFGLIFRFFKPGNYVSYKEDVAGFLSYLIWPSIAIALPRIAMTTKLLRSSLIRELKTDYVRTAYSKGSSKGRVLYRHILKNAFIPVIAFLAMVMADIVAGSIIIEQVFSIPGFGRLLVSSIANRDYPVVQAIVVILAAMVIAVNFLADIIYQWIDPRIRLHT